MLNDDYTRVAHHKDAANENTSQAAPRALVHALWTANDRWPRDTTMCGKLETLDAMAVGKLRVVSCHDCLAKLKRERQFRSADDLTRQRARMREAATQTSEDTASTAESFMGDVVATMQRCAENLRLAGDESLAADMEIVAGRLAEREQIPDSTSVDQASNDTLTYIGPERRMRPRLIQPTPGDQL